MTYSAETMADAKKKIQLMRTKETKALRTISWKKLIVRLSCNKQVINTYR